MNLEGAQVASRGGVADLRRVGFEPILVLESYLATRDGGRSSPWMAALNVPGTSVAIFDSAQIIVTHMAGLDVGGFAGYARGEPYAVAFAGVGRGMVIMTNSDAGSQLTRELTRAGAREYGWPRIWVHE